MHNSNSIRLCRRFFREKSFDFQAGDVPSTLGAFRLWFDFQTCSTLAAGCRPAHPVRSIFRPGGYASQLGKCSFWVHISLNNDLANIKLTLHRILNFESCKKAQKCIKKRRRGCRKRWKIGDYFVLSRSIRSAQACKMYPCKLCPAAWAASRISCPRSFDGRILM